VESQGWDGFGMDERSPFICSGEGDRSLDSGNLSPFLGLAGVLVGLILDTLLRVV
jgi:hypothetical protein